MSANRRTPPPIPARPSSTSRQYSAASSSATNAPPPQLQVNTSSTSRRPELRSTASSFSTAFTASASSWASKAKSGAKIGLNNYAKPMAKAALTKGSNYVGAASEYLQDARGEGVSRSTSDDDSLDSARSRSTRTPEPVDKLHLLPQWAVRKARRDKEGKMIMDDNGKPQYDLEVHVSGYCGAVTSAENAGLILKAALKIMRGVAALPPLVADAAAKVEDKLSTSPISSPTLEKIADQLDKDMQLKYKPRATRTSTMSSVDTVSSKKYPKNNSAESMIAQITQEQLQALHANMEERLAPFRSSVSARRVQVSIYLIALSQQHGRDEIKLGPEDEPLVTNVFTTSNQGLFMQKMIIPWERLKNSPHAEKLTDESSSISMAYGLFIQADLLSEGGPSQLPAAASSISPASSPTFTQRTLEEESKPVDQVATKVDDGANAFFSPIARPLAKGSGGEPGGLQALGKTDVKASVLTNISSPGGVRIISDLDDTVKYSNILGGAREAFRNAFCRSIEDLGIEGMAEMYQALGAAGAAGFHFVSNSPNELLPVIQSFFRHHNFPEGYSLMLKYYGKGHLVNAFMEEPAERKLRGVEAVMNSFPESKFILVGDSGEQDLELYVAVAKARPQQVLAVVIRDVSTAVAKKVQTQSRKPTMSEVDFTALNDALGHVDGQDQAAKAGIGGRKRDAAKKLLRATSGLDLTRLRAHSLSEDSDVSSSPGSPQKQDSMDSMDATSAVATSELPTSPTSSTGKTHPESPKDAHMTQEPISAIGATGSSSDPLASLEDEAREVEEEFQELSATQAKLLRRAAEWNERVVRLSQELPAGVRLLLFREPREVEQTLLQLVRDSK